MKCALNVCPLKQAVEFSLNLKLCLDCDTQKSMGRDTTIFCTILGSRTRKILKIPSQTGDSVLTSKGVN